MEEREDKKQQIMGWKKLRSYEAIKGRRALRRNVTKIRAKLRRQISSKRNITRM